MANLATPKKTEVTVYSQFIPHFEVDAKSNKIKQMAYDRDADLKMIPNSLRVMDWTDMIVDGEPNLPEELHDLFWQTMAGVTQLSIAFGKVGGIIDEDATV